MKWQAPRSLSPAGGRGGASALRPWLNILHAPYQAAGGVADLAGLDGTVAAVGPCRGVLALSDDTAHGAGAFNF